MSETTVNEDGSISFTYTHEEMRQAMDKLCEPAKLIPCEVEVTGPVLENADGTISMGIKLHIKGT